MDEHGGTRHLGNLVRERRGTRAKDRIPIGSDDDGIAPDVVRHHEPPVLEPALLALGRQRRLVLLQLLLQLVALATRLAELGDRLARHLQLGRRHRCLDRGKVLQRGLIV